VEDTGNRMDKIYIGTQIVSEFALWETVSIFFTM
jgi:hypothetical protein